MTPRDWQVFVLARRQEGVVSYSQLAQLGITETARRYKRTGGEWLPVLPSVVRMYWAEPSWLQRAWAACLWAGADAVLSHSTAAALHGLHVASDDRIHFQVGRGQYLHSLATRPEWLVSHTTRAEVPDACVVAGGLRVTSVGRTLIDLLTELPAECHKSLVVRAVSDGVISVRDVRAVFSELSAGRLGARDREEIFAAVSKRA